MNSRSGQSGGRKTLPEFHQDMSLWPGFDDSLLKGETRKRYLRLRDATALYLSDYPLKEVVKTSQLSERRFLRIFSRCFQLDDTGKILGCRAFVARQFKASPIRTMAIRTSDNPRAGFSGMFGKLLRDFPKISDRMVSLLNGYGVNGLRPNKLLFRSIHRSFQKFCSEEGITENQYPLNTGEKARRSLRTWIDREYLPKYASRFTSKEYGQSAGDLLAFGEGDGQSDRVTSGYGGWILDETTVDLNARYELPNNSGGWDQLDLRRFIVLRVIHEKSGANLALLQVFTPQVSAEDISRLLWDAVNGPEPVQAYIEGLKPSDGAGYPANMIPELKFAIPTVVYLDNALAHLSDHVQHIVVSQFGARVILGKPKTPHERAEIESRFATQANRVVHQLPSTTGSGPLDPVRKSSAVTVDRRVRGEELAQVLDAYAQNENILPGARAQNIGPLERLSRLLVSGAIKPLYLPVDKRHSYFFAKPTSSRVKVDIAHGRRPYINYLYERYTSNELAKRFDLKNRKMYIRADFRNIRTVMLFYEDGREFGPIQTIGHWGKFPHDVRIRKMFGRLKRAGELGDRADDRPLEALFSHLRAKAPRNQTAALQLTYLVDYLQRHEFVLNEVLSEKSQSWKDLSSAADSTRVVRMEPRSSPSKKFATDEPTSSKNLDKSKESEFQTPSKTDSKTQGTHAVWIFSKRVVR